MLHVLKFVCGTVIFTDYLTNMYESWSEAKITGANLSDMLITGHAHYCQLITRVNFTIYQICV